MSFLVDHIKQAITDKQTNVVIFSATAIALYGYDQGMMSLINTNENYLSTMGIAEESPVVGVVVAIYYLGCAVGAVLFSKMADRLGRKKSIFFSLATASLGNLIMFAAGMKFRNIALWVMIVGRVIMGLGVGGIDAVIPTYSSELSSDDARGKALAQEFQSNIFGLVMAFGINLGITIVLGKQNQWAWRTPIIVMQIYPVLLMAFVGRLPESPRWFIFNDREDDAKEALNEIYGDQSEEKFEEMKEQHEKEKGDTVGYFDMIRPSHPQFHPTMVTIMCQVNQALTGYGAVSVYGPQIFEVSHITRFGWFDNLTEATATRFFRPQIRISDSRQLHFLLFSYDASLASHRRARPSPPSYPRLSRSLVLLRPSMLVWRPRSEFQQIRYSRHCSRHHRHSNLVHCHWSIRNRLAFHRLADSDRNISYHCPRPRHCHLRHRVGHC